MTIVVDIFSGVGALALLAFCGLVVRSIQRNVKIDDKLGELTREIRDMGIEKEKTHVAIFDQMKYDRDATDRRLRFLEEYFMRGGRIR